MKYLRQFFVILLFSFLGELLHWLIPLQIPASIYGLVLLFAALLTNVVKREQVKECAGLLINVMPVMFIPAGVGLLESVDALLPMLVPVCVILPVSTVLVLAVSGRVTQALMRRGKTSKGEVKS